jgi:hypothetical protein
MIHRLHSMTQQSPIGCLSSDCSGQTFVESFLDSHLWVVEEELRMCIGLPPWFDSALGFIVGDIVRDLATRKAQTKCFTARIRAKARRVVQKFDARLAADHTENGFVKVRRCESLQAVVGSVLRRQRSLYWEELCLPKSLSPRCGPLGGAD